MFTDNFYSDSLIWLYPPTSSTVSKSISVLWYRRGLFSSVVYLAIIPMIASIHPLYRSFYLSFWCPKNQTLSANPLFSPHCPTLPPKAPSLPPTLCLLPSSCASVILWNHFLPSGRRGLPGLIIHLCPRSVTSLFFRELSGSFSGEWCLETRTGELDVLAAGMALHFSFFGKWN